MSWIPETLRLIIRSGWCDGILDRGWAGNAELLLGGDRALSVVRLPGFSAIECYKAKNQRGLTSSNSMHRQVCTKRPSMGVIRKESPPCTGQRSYMIEEGSPIDEEGMSASQCLLVPRLICAMPSR